MSRQKTNKSPKRKRRDNRSAQNYSKSPSFKLTGLIVLAAVAIMLFGFSPRAGAKPDSPIKQFVTNIGQTIHKVTDVISNRL